MMHHLAAAFSSGLAAIVLISCGSSECQLAEVSAPNGQPPIALGASPFGPCLNEVKQRTLQFRVHHECATDLAAYQIVVAMNYEEVYRGQYTSDVKTLVDVCEDRPYSITIGLSQPGGAAYAWYRKDAYVLSNKSNGVDISLRSAKNVDDSEGEEFDIDFFEPE